MANRTTMQKSTQNSLILNAAFMTHIAHGATGGVPSLLSDAHSKRDAAWDCLATAAQLTKDGSEALKDIPYVKAIAGPLYQIIQIQQTIQGNEGRTWEIVSRIVNDSTNILQSLAQLPHDQGLEPFNALQKDLQDFQKFLGDVLRDKIKPLIQQSSFQAFVRRKENSDILISIERELNDFMQRAQFQKLVGIEARAVKIEAKADEIALRLKESSWSTVLNFLALVEKAKYDSEEAPPRGPCTKGTRIEVLSKIENWASDPDDYKIYCLEGIAGTGKTSISYSVCKILNDRGSLGGSFFCSRADLQCNDATRITATLMAQLAHTFPSVRNELLKLESSSDRSFRNIVVAPLMAAAESLNSMKRPIIFVIDALDECANQAHVQALLGNIWLCAGSLPVKFFITFRPDRTFLEYLPLKIHGSASGFVLHDVEKDLVERDIELFVTEYLTELGTQRRISDWPTERERKELAKKSGSLFIFAATACKHIGAKGDARNRLSELLQTPRLKGIDDLYRAILDQSFTDLTGSEEHELRNILSAVVSAQTLLTLASLQCLLQLKSDAEQLLTDLHSVLRISVDTGHVSVFHASFTDFLYDTGRAQSHFVDSEAAHQMMTTRCLKMLGSSLRQGVVVHGEASELWAPQDEVKLAALYASRFWPAHCCLSPKATPDLLRELLYFLKTKTLQWIEYAGAIGAVSMLISALVALEAWLPQDEKEVVARIVDARRFMAQNASILSADPLEAYRSCLAWLPNNSHIKTEHKNICTIGISVSGLRNDWDACELVITSNSGKVQQVIFSIDGAHIVSGTNDHTVRLWNSLSGELENILIGHSDGVTSIAFSGNGYRLVSGSKDKTVRIWNVASGEPEHILSGHSDRVDSVAFSNDGSHIVSGSRDKTVQIWNAESGQLEKILRGHSKGVTSVAFSDDGVHIASASDDTTVRVWNVSSGELENVLRGHKKAVLSVAFSADGSRIVSGSGDRKVRVWNTMSGKSESILVGHRDCVTSATFSNDGSRIVSGSRDKSVRVWSITSGESENFLTGHSDWVRSVAFSHDGSRVVSGSSDGTVRVWNTLSGDLEINMADHLKNLKSIVFSRDGSRIVSGSRDTTVQIWNVASGESEKILTGHSKAVLSVALSCDEFRIASGSEDNTVRIWNVASGRAERILTGHENKVTSVAFSIDGFHVVSGSGDHTIAVWDAISGDLGRILRGHQDCVRSVAFSNDGSSIVSGSDDRTVRIWNTASGKSENVLKRHTRPVQSVAFSSDCSRIASVSGSTVQVWNTISGKLEHTLKDHLQEVLSVAFSDDGSHVVTRAKNRTVLVWNSASGQEFAAVDHVASPDLNLPRTRTDDHTLPLPSDFDHPLCSLLTCQGHIIHRKSHTRLWIPSSFSNYGFSAVHDNVAVLGYSTGRVLVISFPTPSTPVS